MIIACNWYLDSPWALELLVVIVQGIVHIAFLFGVDDAHAQQSSV